MDIPEIIYITLSALSMSIFMGILTGSIMEKNFSKLIILTMVSSLILPISCIMFIIHKLGGV